MVKKIVDTKEFKEKVKKEVEKIHREDPDYERKKEDDRLLGKKNRARIDKYEREKGLLILKEQYDNIKDILKTYIDLKEEYYTIIALWIIGTYLHDEFESFPYLYFNAMRGSGKTRTLRLVCYLAKEGNLMASPTEAVLFRVKGTLGIDEFERVANKDKGSIRELLNAAYKKGIKVFRMKKQKSKEGEELVAEEFEPYRPIIMANIWGMEEVLEDRCITLILEKSNHPTKTRLTEDFSSNPIINYIKDSLNGKITTLNENNYTRLKSSNLGTSAPKLKKECSLCSFVLPKNINTLWNNYIFDRYNTTLTTHITHTTHTTQTTPKQIKITSLFNKIHDSNIIGRSLELFLPLFFLADIINKEVLDETIKIAKNITSEKAHEQEVESIDVMVLDFVSQKEEGLEYFSMKELTNEFRNFSDEGAEWLNSRWFGRALKRLNLIIDKRRKGYGIEVILNVSKAKEKIRMFKK